MCKLTAAVTVCAAAALLPSLAAENRNWTGGGTQDANGYYMVSAGDNWGGTAPCANDNLFFTSPSEVSITNDTSLVYNAAPFNAGTYNFYGDLAVSSGNVRIPLADQNTSTLCKKNGNWTVASEFHVGYGSGSSGTFIHSGGTLTLSKKPIYIGSTAYASYTAKMTIDGGTVHASCPISGNNRSVILGWNENGTGTAELTVSGTGRLVGANHIWLGRGAAGS